MSSASLYDDAFLNGDDCLTRLNISRGGQESFYDNGYIPMIILELKCKINVQVIAAEGEQKSSKALKEASDIISTSPAALQLRLTQSLSSQVNTIIFSSG